MSVYIISELCGQWGGSVEKAKAMINQSMHGGADAVKVQLWDTYRMPGENREAWEYLTMTNKQFLDLKQYCETLGIDFFASPFHKDRYGRGLEAGLGVNKIASSMLEWDLDLCQEMVDNKDLLTYCSLGKWDKEEFPFDNENVKYMHCVAKYPHSLEEAIKLMPDKFDDPLIGYSDHSIGIEACKEAVRRGAKVLEKHYTLSHSLQCKTESSHVCSMVQEELIELRKYCDGLSK